MTTHAAVVTASLRGPLQVIQVPTIKPSDGEVLVNVKFTASTPLDLHQNDGGLLVTTYPQVLGDSMAGVVVELGEGIKDLKIGDKVCVTTITKLVNEGTFLTRSLQVFGYLWREQKEKGQQEYVTVSEYLLGKVRYITI